MTDAGLAPLLRTWLPRQRWYAGTTTPSIKTLSTTHLTPPSPTHPALIQTLIETDPHHTYQLLLGVRETLPPHLAPALIGHITQGPLAGQTVYEALLDPRLTNVLLERLRHPGTLGNLRFTKDGSTTIPPALPSRPLTTEQSNTSLIYGDKFILKVFRQVTPGRNPDLELQQSISAEGCAHTLPPVAWFETTHKDPHTLAILQPYLNNSQDAWELALKSPDFTHEAHELGRATADIHLSLARALPTVTLARTHTTQLAQAMKDRLTQATRTVPALHAYASALHTAFDALASDTTPRTAQRVHGDLHLGQCLRSPEGTWSIIDFEGEPARPLAERRLPHPPARDIAGMLRSFDYASGTNPDWSARCRDAYCEGYTQTTGHDPRTDPVLLRAYETDKAIYETVYEAQHRPDWLQIPMRAIARLAGETAPRPPTYERGRGGVCARSTPAQAPGTDEGGAGEGMASTYTPPRPRPTTQDPTSREAAQ
ncbi:maltokinase [Streptomyces sp. NPDC058067]|uniref:maltokinase N-terminal cap-like domain-containing protein n=1 Tax=Streptomyces sp. NPDC058067 TaxID=3346324 RepID=UPI0036ED83A6